MKQVQDNKTVDMEDIFIWPDQSWCYRYEYNEVGESKSDDFYVLEFGSPAWIGFVNIEG